jgi:hypothetical protein
MKYEYVIKILEEKLCPLREDFTYWFNRKNKQQVDITQKSYNATRISYQIITTGGVMISENDFIFIWNETFGVDVFKGKNRYVDLNDLKKFYQAIINALIEKQEREREP